MLTISWKTCFHFKYCWSFIKVHNISITFLLLINYSHKMKPLHTITRPKKTTVLRSSWNFPVLNYVSLLSCHCYNYQTSLPAKQLTFKSVSETGAPGAGGERLPTQRGGNSIRLPDWKYFITLHPPGKSISECFPQPQNHWLRHTGRTKAANLRLNVHIIRFGKYTDCRKEFSVLLLLLLLLFCL